MNQKKKHKTVKIMSYILEVKQLSGTESTYSDYAEFLKHIWFIITLINSAA